MENNMFNEICSYENLYLAFERASKGKTYKEDVIKFGKDLEKNLLKLKEELILKTYKPKPLETFILRDPKTRKISKSDFRDRIVHHAICNIIESIFDKIFIYDSYANRLGKGCLKAVERFNNFKRKITKNNTRICYILKADIKYYFETVNHNILLELIYNKIGDENVMNLIKVILNNYSSSCSGRDDTFGMPLGNLTSQFFANIYLNELDQYIKHELKIKYYIRYVDDFVILNISISKLKECQEHINNFLQNKLLLELHPDKTKIVKLENGVNFLGFRIFYHNKIIRKKNIIKFERKLKRLKTLYDKELIERDKVIEVFEGWIAYVKNADTYKYRRTITRKFNKYFPAEEPAKINNVQKNENFKQKIIISNYKFSNQKTLQLLKKGLTIKQISEQRQIKISTVYEHISKLIEYNQYPIWKILDKYKIQLISSKIYSENDKLKEIKERIKNIEVNYDEINLVLAYIKLQNKKYSINYHLKNYKYIHCFRKCYSNPPQKIICYDKMRKFINKVQNLEMTKYEFLNLFNSHMNICTLLEK